MAVRIQLSRRKGFRLAAASDNPLGVVNVARPSRWGNPYRAGRTYNAHDAVRAYRQMMERMKREEPEHYRALLEPLRGKDLACWCPLVDYAGKPVPCHAQILLELANDA